MYRKLFLYSGSFLILSFLSFVVVRGALSQRVSHKPFTAFEIEKRYDAAGVERYQEALTYAVRSDGSSSQFVTRPGADGTLYKIGDVFDVPSQRVTSVDGFTESTATKALTPAEVAFQETADRTCQSGTAHSTILGLDVVKVVKPSTPTHPLEITKWAAPGLDCYVLSMTALKYINGKPGPKTIRDTVSLIPGEPQASVFAVPANYVERSPSQIADEFARRFGRHPFEDSVLQRAEEKYQARRP